LLHNFIEFLPFHATPSHHAVLNYMNQMWPNAAAKTHNVFLIGESYLAWRNGTHRGNVQKGLEDLGFNVENFAQSGITISNFWWSSHMSWEKWSRIQKQDAMVISIGFNQLSDEDMSVKDEAEVENVVQQALEQSNNVIVLLPNQPLLEYFTVRAEWFIERLRDDLNDPHVTSNALKRQQLYANRFQKLVKLLKGIQESHQMLQIVEMDGVLMPEDICDDGCHLNHQGAVKTANAIAQALKSQRVTRGKTCAYVLMALLAILALKLTRSQQKHILFKLTKGRLSPSS